MLTILSVTERARRLRAQYSLQAQGLRSRIEIRINRIPTSLRKMKMGDLLQKFIDQEQAALRGPPVPAKDYPVRQTQQKTARSQAVGRAQKRLRYVNKQYTVEVSLLICESATKYP